MLAWDAVIVLALLLACELALRRFAPEYRRNVYDQEMTGSAPMGFNAAGYRGPLPAVKKPSDELRVLALGDSVTFGTGLAVEETWPAQLADMLRRHQPASVINGGMAAADLNQLRLAYERQWSAYSPRVVTLVATGNMVSLAWIRRGDKPGLPHNGYLHGLSAKSIWNQCMTAARRAVSGLCVSAFASINTRLLLYAAGILDHRVIPSEPYGPMLAYGWRQGGLDPSLSDEAWRRFEIDLATLAASVHSHGGRLVAAFAPPRFLLSPARSDNLQFVPTDRLTIDPMERFRTLCERLAIEQVDLPPALRASRLQIEIADHRFAPMYVLGDFTHFDDAGSKSVAQAFSALISTPRAAVKETNSGQSRRLPDIP